MENESPWKRTARWKPPHGFGFAVERGEQLGYAKRGVIAGEILASRLAAALEAPIPKVEVAPIEGEYRTVSFVCHPEDYRLAEPHDLSRTYTPLEIKAISSGSGLLAFTTWIDAFDHASEANYVVQVKDRPNLRIAAIDFEDAFQFPSGNEALLVRAPAVFLEHVDRQLVAQMACRINAVVPETIHSLAAEVGLPECGLTLINRQHRLKESLRHYGLLP